MKHTLRRLRGALGNAVVWGSAWFAGTLVLGSALYLSGLSPIGFLRMVVSPAVSTGITGFVVGAAFSVLVGVAYRDRQITDIKARTFALGGAVTAGLLLCAFTMVPLIMAGMNAPLGAWLLTIAWGAVFGGVTAGMSIRLAQQAARVAADGPLGELKEEQEEVLSLLDSGAV